MASYAAAISKSPKAHLQNHAGNGAVLLTTSGSLLVVRMQEGMLLDDVPGPSTDLMDEDRIGAGSGRPKRRR